MEVSDINAHFYGSDGPADYFLLRLASLMTISGEPDAVSEILKSGVVVAGTRVAVGSDGLFDDKVLQRYVVVESQVLLHHASEALIRLFLAHRTRSRCPWLDIVAAKNPSAFKKKLQTDLDDPLRPSHRTDIGYVFLGGSGPLEEEDAWEAAVENLSRFFWKFVKDWLADATLYNSAKHGLTVLPGETEFNIGTNEDQMVSMASGDSLTFLEHGRWESETDSRSWSLTTKWIDVGQTLALIHIACLMLNSLWEVAQASYVDGSKQLDLFFPDDLSPIDLRLPGQQSVNRFSMTVLEERRGD